MKEYLLSTNEYREPKVAQGSDAYAYLIIRLLLLEPGLNPLHPAMGVGLGPKYRFILDSDIPKLESRIRDQINTYLPESFGTFTDVRLELKENTKYLLVKIITNEIEYVLDTQESSVPIELTDAL